MFLPSTILNKVKSRLQSNCEQFPFRRNEFRWNLPINQFSSYTAFEESRASIACQNAIMFSRAGITTNNAYQSKMLKLSITIHKWHRIAVIQCCICVGTVIRWHILWCRRPCQKTVCWWIASNWWWRAMIYIMHEIPTFLSHWKNCKKIEYNVKRNDEKANDTEENLLHYMEHDFMWNAHDII